MSEIYNIEKHIYTTLKNSSGITSAVGSRIYNPVVEGGTAYPAITYQILEPSDIIAAGGARLMTESAVRISAVTNEKTFAIIDSIADIIDGLFNNNLGTGAVWASYRARPYTSVYDVRGVTYRERGGIYVFYAQAV